MKTCLGLLLTASLTVSAQVSRYQDAGTWVRKSFTIAPGAVAPCPDEEVFLSRARSLLPRPGRPLRPYDQDERIRHYAARLQSACQDMRQGMAAGLSGDWSGLLAMERFDQNPLPRPPLVSSAIQYLTNGTDGLGNQLQADLGDTLQALLYRTALTRSRHLGADYQQNSLLHDKLKTEDLTDVELGLVRKSAYVALVRARNPDMTQVENKKKERIWSGSATLEMVLFSFDPTTKAFRLISHQATSVSGDEGSPEEIGLALARKASSFSTGVLELADFQFTSQVISLDGSWLRPAADFKANTRADLAVHRRFRYLEMQQGKDGRDREKEIGYGFVDHVSRDSLYRVRHIGGQSPYIGMKVIEVPGTWWATFGYAYENTEVSSGIRTDDERLLLRHLSPAPTLRLQIRGNTPGDLPCQYVGIDMAGSVGNATGSYDRFSSYYGSDSTWGASTYEIDGLAAFELSAAWGLRFPIRRLFLTAGLQAGIRGTWLFLGSEKSSLWNLDRSRMLSIGSANDESDNAENARAGDAWLGLTAGAQWSISAYNGLGIEWRWEALRARSSWDITQGNGDDARSVRGNPGGLGRMQLTFQWIFR